MQDAESETTIDQEELSDRAMRKNRIEGLIAVRAKKKELEDSGHSTLIMWLVFLSSIEQYGRESKVG